VRSHAHRRLRLRLRLFLITPCSNRNLGPAACTAGRPKPALHLCRSFLIFFLSTNSRSLSLTFSSVERCIAFVICHGALQGQARRCLCSSGIPRSVLTFKERKAKKGGRVIEGTAATPSLVTTPAAAPTPQTQTPCSTQLEAASTVPVSTMNFAELPFFTEVPHPGDVVAFKRLELDEQMRSPKVSDWRVRSIHSEHCDVLKPQRRCQF
jgi:hypothetical protein